MAEWTAHVRMLAPGPTLAQAVAAVAQASGRHRVLVLDGSSRRDQVAAAITALRRPRPAIVMADSTWKPGIGIAESTASRLGIRAIDGPQSIFCVLSRFEVGSFPRTWGPLRGQVRFVPWPHTLTPEQLAEPTSEGGRVFAGGNSLRDYGTLIRAAGSLHAPVDIATNTLTDAQRKEVPANVTVALLAQSDYDAYMRAASVVVVPLAVRPDRSSGQTTYVNAMARGKALVVTDTPGVRDYIEDGRTGLIIPREDPDAMAAAVTRLLADDDLRHAIGARAREHTLATNGLTHYAGRLLALADEFLSR